MLLGTYARAVTEKGEMGKMEGYREKTPLGANIHYFIKWTLIAVVTGCLVGLVGTAFGKGVALATSFWQSHHWTLFLMPVAGLFIVWLYRVTKEEKNRGTNMVIASISSDEKITFATAPLIFFSTIISHSVSASVGREGAALQLGGALGDLFGRILHLDEKDKKIAVMCGMSACFAAVFGTPLAAGIFAMEVVSIGVMYYSALVPCLFAAFLGAGIAGRLGLAPEAFPVGEVPQLTVLGAVFAVILAMICACAGILLCVSLHNSGKLAQKFVPNPYLRVLAGSAIFIVLTLIFHERYYNGGGMQLIERCFEGESVPVYAFLMKIVFTSVALSAGFKGGEIVPTLTVGACVGYLVSGILPIPSALGTAMGMACLFVSVTNCPVSTIFMAFELFGFEAMPYFAIAVAVSFTLSGYYGLYSSQKFIYSKIRNEYINRKSH